ncbi:hypothetical protein OROGR_031796 [Orobanche gracilis]
MGGIPPPHQIPTEATVKRNKFLFRSFLISNFALAAINIIMVSVSMGYFSDTQAYIGRYVKKHFDLEMVPFEIFIPKGRECYFVVIWCINSFVIKGRAGTDMFILGFFASVLVLYDLTYIFWKSGNKPRRKEKSVVPAEVASVPSAVITPTESAPVISPPITRPVIVRKPVPEDEQREIFKWMLEEKRKAKPVSREHKRRIDEDKAILKEFIRSSSIPSI